VTVKQAEPCDDVIEFEAASHEYRLGGKVLPSVTRVLADLSPIKHLDPAVLAPAAERGKDVHLACQLYDLDQLDESSITPEIEPYLFAWQTFRSDYLVRCLEVERIVYAHGYAGTLDRYVQWAPGRRIGLRFGLLEIKTGAADPTHGPQTAAYLHALLSMKKKLLPRGSVRGAPTRAAVYLGADGRYRVELHQDPADLSIFMAALTTYHFKARYGLI
jgi:hypothetical protein